MLTISKPLSASQVQTYLERGIASERQNYWSHVQRVDGLSPERDRRAS